MKLGGTRLQQPVLQQQALRDLCSKLKQAGTRLVATRESDSGTGACTRSMACTVVYCTGKDGTRCTLI